MSKFKSIPAELEGVLKHSSGSWKLTSFKTWAMGWVATIHVQKGRRQFRLVSDRGYIDAYDVTGDQEQHLFPPEDQRLEISPAQVATLIETALETN
jgi:hypothetical protein